MPLTPALRFMDAPATLKSGSTAVVFGDESFLRAQTLTALERTLADSSASPEDVAPTRFEGADATWPKVWEELATYAMFSDVPRLVEVRAADDFVTKNRAQIEEYVAAPSGSGILVLEMTTCAANTKLYKNVLERGELVDCRSLPGSDLSRWLVQAAAKKYGFKLLPDAAALMVEQISTEMGLLDQELAKLALLAEPGKPVTVVEIRKNTGSWRLQTVWTLIDTILEGDAPDALRYLGQLLDSGEAPIAILAQLASNLRRLAAATRIVISDERMGRRPDLNQALQLAGVNPSRGILAKAQRQLRFLGRQRGQKLLEWIVQLDFDLKGDSTLPDRLLLERFVLQLAMATRSPASGAK